MDIDANLPLTIRPMSEFVLENTLQWSFGSVFLAVFGGCAAWCLWRSSAPGHMRIAWPLYVGLALSLGQIVWIEDWAFLRALTEFYLLGAILMLTGPRIIRRGIAVYVGVLWLVVVKTYLH